MVKTVGQLKEALKQFPDEMEIRLLLSWDDHYATSDRNWDSIGKGIEVDVYRDYGCCILSNENTGDITAYKY